MKRISAKTADNISRLLRSHLHSIMNMKRTFVICNVDNETIKLIDKDIKICEEIIYKMKKTVR